MEEDERYQRAKKRARELREFYSNLGSYVTINLILLVIDAISGGGWWFYWVTIFWGIGILFHAMRLFGGFPKLDKDWEERKIREIMAREEGGKPKRTTTEDYFDEG
jgi:hypothetical protein